MNSGGCEQHQGRRWARCHGEGVPEELGRKSISWVSGLWDCVCLHLAGCWKYMSFPTAAKQRDHIPHGKMEFYLRDDLRDVEGRQLLLKDEHSQNWGGLLPTSKYFWVSDS